MMSAARCRFLYSRALGGEIVMKLARAEARPEAAAAEGGIDGGRRPRARDQGATPQGWSAPAMAIIISHARRILPRTRPVVYCEIHASFQARYRAAARIIPGGRDGIPEAQAALHAHFCAIGKSKRPITKTKSGGDIRRWRVIVSREASCAAQPVPKIGRKSSAQHEEEARRRKSSSRPRSMATLKSMAARIIGDAAAESYLLSHQVNNVSYVANTS